MTDEPEWVEIRNDAYVVEYGWRHSFEDETDAINAWIEHDRRWRERYERWWDSVKDIEGEIPLLI